MLHFSGVTISKTLIIGVAFAPFAKLLFEPGPGFLVEFVDYDSGATFIVSFGSAMDIGGYVAVVVFSIKEYAKRIPAAVPHEIRRRPLGFGVREGNSGKH